MSKFFLDNTLVLVVVPAACYVLCKMFRETWKDMDNDSVIYNTKLILEKKYDYRPLALFVIAGICLTIQEYYCKYSFYYNTIYPLLIKFYHRFPFIRLEKYDSLYRQVWSNILNIFVYCIIPFTTWKIFFPKDSLLDFGLRSKDFFRHTRLYLFYFLILAIAVTIASFKSDFINYYPFYSKSSRSWFDLIMWELLYLQSFFFLEIFFRGWWLVTLGKKLGSSAIFSMIVPYCMIHYSKPYLECIGAMIGAMALGSLSMKTKSIYQGAILHMSLALAMDLVSLARKGAFPIQFWP